MTPPTLSRFTRICKRNGEIATFDQNKITHAIQKAVESVGGKDFTEVERLSDEVVRRLNEKFHARSIPAVEEIQDMVERVLIENKHVQTAKAFILYRARQQETREKRKAIIGSYEEVPFSDNALQVLAKRYLLKDEAGNLKENPTELLGRVAKNISSAEKLYKGDPKYWSERFYNLMASLDFLPNSPTLMNAGTDIQQLSACFVLPVEDSMEGIFGALTRAALIHKSGGGTGFSFSRLRPSADIVKSTTGVSSGPISFMKVFDSATEVIKQGGKRRGANMGVLRVDHPDILDFIQCKADMTTLQNFNISVALTDKFMDALESDGDYDLVNPRNSQPIRKLPAREVFNLIVANAWKNGDPGLIFIDEINRKNAVAHLGNIESTNPCGEQPLLSYESCNLGSINLNNMLTENGKKIDWEKLGETVEVAVRFLDDVIDLNKYPIPEIAEMTKRTRKIGLGVMGFADLLCHMEIPYNSEDGLKTGEKVMKFIQEKSVEASVKLAEERGVFPGWKGSLHEKKGLRLRNAALTTCAPTGTISMLADVSSGIEPHFAMAYTKNVMDGAELAYVNKIFERVARERGFYSSELLRQIAKEGTLQNLKEIPADVRQTFVVAYDISPEYHLRMQAAFQKHVDSAISKTINFPAAATMRDVEEAYVLAYKLKCKGVTIYRDKSRENQVLTMGVSSTPKKKEEVKLAPAPKILEPDCCDENGTKKSKSQLLKEGFCPECGSKLKAEEGCATCVNGKCGFSACNI